MSSVCNDHITQCTSVLKDKPLGYKVTGKVMMAHGSSAALYSCADVKDFCSKVGISASSLSVSTCHRAAVACNRGAMVSFSDSFAYLESFIQQLIAENKGTSYTYNITLDNDGQSRFARLAILFEAEANVAINCKPIISLDAGYLKEQWDAYQILVCATQDGENRDCSFGIAIVPSESEENYKFFIDTLKKNLRLKEYLETDGLVVISDRCKGLLNAVKDNLPNSHHRHCALHLLGNIKKGRAFTEADHKLYWSIVRAKTKVDYEEGMNNLLLSHKEAYDYLSSLDPSNWCDFAFPGVCWGHVTNNLAERAVKYIGSDANDVRSLPIIDLMRSYIQKV